MRILYPLIIIYIGFVLSSCASPTCCTPVSHTSPIKTALNSHKDPLSISFYPTNLKPKKPYSVLGEENISKYNTAGIKRQEASVREAMRELAASMGGDAVIDIKHDAQTISGTVVAYSLS